VLGRRAVLSAAGAVAAASLLPRIAMAQERTAAEIAAAVQTFYDQTTGVRARFQQDYWSNVYRRTTTSRGNLVISRPGRFRFDYTLPNGKVVVSDGTTFTYYEPGEEGDAGQYWTGTADGASAGLGFLTGTARIQSDYRASLGERRPSTSADVDVLELVPRRSDPHVARLRLYVGNTDASRGVARRVSIEDHEGNWNTFTFTGLEFPDAIEGSTFRYAPPDGAREISPPSGE
jgi:outer membrane lipoprotein carrier protein